MTSPVAGSAGQQKVVKLSAQHTGHLESFARVRIDPLAVDIGLFNEESGGVGGHRSMGAELCIRFSSGFVLHSVAAIQCASEPAAPERLYWEA